jgi:hypothetical protein
VQIRKLRHEERGEWLHLREFLWPDTSREELTREQQEILADSEKNCVFVAALPGGDLVGFVEVAFREWAESATGNRATNDSGRADPTGLAPG